MWGGQFEPSGPESLYRVRMDVSAAGGLESGHFETRQTREAEKPEKWPNPRSREFMDRNLIDWPTN